MQIEQPVVLLVEDNAAHAEIVRRHSGILSREADKKIPHRRR